MQSAHRGERGEVEILAEHEGPDDLHQFFVPRSGDGARLDPGIALPLAPLRDEVAVERIEARDERPGGAVGPQAHVDPKHESVLGRPGQELDQPAAGALVALGGVVRAGVEEHEVDVGGHVELAPA